MSTASIVRTATTLGKTFRTTRSASSDGAVIKDPTLAAAKIGALTTRTDANTGTLTMNSGHGITTGANLHLYWVNVDGTLGHRYSVVGTVATNSVPIDNGAGDDLPALVAGTFAITAMVPQSETFAVATAALQGLFVGAGVPAQAIFLDGSSAVVLAAYVEGGDDAYQWDDGDDAANPLSANVATVLLSHGSSAGSKQVNAVALVN